LRVTGSIEDLGVRAQVTTGLLAATWAESADVSDATVVAGVLDRLDLDSAAILARAQSPEAKDRLRRDTGDAIERGVFGVPTMIVDDRLFWGYDDLINVDRYLAGEDPLEDFEMPSWAGVKPTAQRRR
jgi:2-hydroxychromene-2-carboxylate isomerase